jgi:integrase
MQSLPHQRQCAARGQPLVPFNFGSLEDRIGKCGRQKRPAWHIDEGKNHYFWKVSCHDLRRTYLTIAESCDVPAYALKALANHSTRSDITSIYVQMTPERLRAPVQKIADKIKLLCGIEPSTAANVVQLAQYKGCFF